MAVQVVCSWKGRTDNSKIVSQNEFRVTNSGHTGKKKPSVILKKVEIAFFVQTHSSYRSPPYTLYSHQRGMHVKSNGEYF